MDKYILSRKEAITVFFAFAFGYFLSCLLRAITAALCPVFTLEFDLMAADLWLLDEGYFLGFASMQISFDVWGRVYKCIRYLARLPRRGQIVDKCASEGKYLLFKSMTYVFNR